jgi:hypothetical protein
MHRNMHILILQERFHITWEKNENKKNFIFKNGFATKNKNFAGLKIVFYVLEKVFFYMDFIHV